MFRGPADVYDRFVGRYGDALAAEMVRVAGVERGQRALDVVGLDHQIEIVTGLGPAARPAGEAPAEQERHLGAAQRRGRLLERGLEVGERLLVIGGHAQWLPAAAQRVCPNG